MPLAIRPCPPGLRRMLASGRSVYASGQSGCAGNYRALVPPIRSIVRMASSRPHEDSGHNKAILADWGTSSFRAFYVNVNDGTVIDSVSSNSGGILNVKDFDEAFESHCKDWPRTAPVFICGMAGSNRGWREVKYASVPATAENVRAQAEKFTSKSGRSITIFSGLWCSQSTPYNGGQQVAPDVIRGEETQIFGALEMLDDQRITADLIILPGTHSKWAVIDPAAQQVNYFKTYMTGEMFSIISKHSILRPAQATSSPVKEKEFRKGVEIAKQSRDGFLADLFQVRRRVLAKEVDETGSLSLLSGIVIGHEVSSGMKNFRLSPSSGVAVVGSDSLLSLYQLAFQLWNIEPVLLNGEEISRKGLLSLAGFAVKPSRKKEKESRASTLSSPKDLLVKHLARCPLVAILRGIKPSEARSVCSVLHDAGYSIVEVPWNSPNCLESIRTMKEAFGDSMLIGAGTIDTVEKVHAVADAGGAIIVSPNFNPDVVAAAVSRGLIMLPGVTTPSEAFAALEAGAHGLKLFPAEMISVAGFKAFKTVLPSDALMLPVGGIDVETIPRYMKAGARSFGLGSSLYKAGFSPAEVSRRATELFDAVKNSR